MTRKVLLFNNMISSGGGDSPSAILINDQLYCHLDAKDIKLSSWDDRKGNYNFTSDVTLGINQSAYNLTCEKHLKKYKMAYSNDFTFGTFPFTLEFTVNISKIESYGKLCSNVTESLFTINRRGNNYIGIYSSKMSPNNKAFTLRYDEINDSTLHILDFVFVDHKELNVYLDGVLKTNLTSVTFNDEFITTKSFSLGAKSDSTNHRITGELYSFRFYKKSLSEFEMRCNCLYEANQGRTSTSTTEQSETFKAKWK